MKLGILGTGMIAQEFLDGIHELNLEKVYIFGRKQSKEKTNHLAKKYHLDKVFYNYNEILSSDIDTVYVALPNSLHYKFAKEALQAGKHVILEKPSTANLNELLDLVDIAKQKQKLLFEASLVFFFPILKQIKKDLNKLGDIKIVSMNFSQYSSRYDKFKKGEIAPVFDPKYAGGALMDLNIYNINFLLALFGEPKEVYYYPNIEKEIDTSGILIADYKKFKASCIAAKSCEGQKYAIIEGDNGVLSTNNSMNDAKTYKIKYKENNHMQHLERDFRSSHHRLYYEFKYFIDCIDNLNFKENEKCIRYMIQACKILQNVDIK